MNNIAPDQISKLLSADDVNDLRLITTAFSENASGWFSHDDLHSPETILRFQRLGLVDLTKGTVQTSVASPLAFEVLAEIENPPLPDYWRGLKRWLFRSRWRVAVVAAAFVLPCVVQWVEMLRTVLSWCFPGVFDQSQS